VTAVASGRVSLRLAVRLVRRAPGRSALIAALVAIPVLAGTFALVTISTARLSPEQAATRYLGHADAIAQVTAFTRLDPLGSVIGRGVSYSGESIGMESQLGRHHRPRATLDLATLLPAGARFTASPTDAKSLRVTFGKLTAEAQAHPLDFTDPISRGLDEIESGTAPTGPGQIAVTTTLAHRLHLSPGDRVSVSGIGPATVTAVVRDPRALSEDAIAAPLATFGGIAGFQHGAYSDPTWLISFPGHQAPDLHAAMAARGIIFETRRQWENPPPELRTSSRIDSQVVAVLGSIILFGIAEIVLLAGTAFAVGTRRQVRELGLLRATGGDETDVRRVVLAQGLVLGVIGAVAGVLAGVLAVFFARPLLEHFADKAFGPLDGRPLEIAAVALVGVVAGLLAAVIPARSSARLPILDMLRTRFPVDEGVVRNPRWAWAALVVGPLVVVGAAYGWHHSRDNGGAGASLSVSVDQVGSAFTSVAHDGRWTTVISLGAAITLAGLARSCPTLLTRLGRLAHRLPLSLRLATRDAARHRHRTAPAAAAVATVVAGAVLVLFVASSTDVRNRRAYTPYTPVGTALVSSSSLAVDGALAREYLPVRSIGRLGVIGPPSHGGNFAQIAAHSPGCVDSPDQSCQIGHVDTADAAAVDIIAGRHVPAAAQLLADGGAVVLVPGLAVGGRVGIDTVTGRRQAHVDTTTLPAMVIPGVRFYDGISEILVSTATAQAHGWPVLGEQALVATTHMPSTRQQDELQHALGRNGSVIVERGYHAGLGLLLLALVGAAALAALAGTSIAVALAMAESRADMATLAAVGASPSRRRIHAMAQAAAVGGLGTALGVGLGALVGVSLLQGSASYPFTLPVRWLLLLVAVAPLLAITVAGAVTRGRVDLTRRIA
jgi:putative ABC transport system permease protein